MAYWPLGKGINHEDFKATQHIVPSTQSDIVETILKKRVLAPTSLVV